MPRRTTPLWLAAPSRFAGWNAWRARVLLGLVAILSLLSLGALRLTGPAASDEPGMGDLMLYEGIVAGVRAGGDYYRVAADAMRAGSYPLHPFVAVRLPLHGVVQAALPGWLVLYLLYALAVGVAAAWWRRLSDGLRAGPPRLIALFLLAGGMVAFVQPGLVAFHEIWAAQLCALALALRRPERWIESAALVLVAMLVRETAALVALVMLGFAGVEGRRREAIGWALVLAGFAAALVAHAWGVAQVATPLDARSPGWAGLGGVGFAAWAIIQATALQMLPLAIAAPLVVIAAFGWWASDLRTAACLAGWLAALAMFARPDTFYWALMPAPLILVGLAFAPDSMRDLLIRAIDRRRVRVLRVSE